MPAQVRRWPFELAILVIAILREDRPAIIRGSARTVKSWKTGWQVYLSCTACGVLHASCSAGLANPLFMIPGLGDAARPTRELNWRAYNALTWTSDADHPAKTSFYPQLSRLLDSFWVYFNPC